LLVLHIGRHKCGSSSIQSFMSGNAERLRELGVLYPGIGRNRDAHHQLAQQLRNGDFGSIDQIAALKADHADDCVVVSSEGLWQLRESEVAELRARTARQNVMIVLYIRDLAGWIPSRYNEYTRRGINLLNFDEFYERHNLSNGLRIVSSAELWARSFGWENIRVRSLDKRSLTGGTLVDDFLSLFGLSLVDFGGADAAGLEPRNLSLGWKVLEVLRAQFAELARHPDNHETRRGRPYLKRHIASALRESLVDLMAQLNLSSQRTQYVSARQWSECDDVYGREVERLNQKLVGPKIPLPEPQMIVERPFLPTIHQIPSAERREIASRLAGGTGRRFLPPAVVEQARLAL
jgi:hypothetical protein